VLVLLMLLTFLLGVVLSQVSLCAVAAVQQWMVARQGTGLWRLLLAASGAGVVLLMLNRWAPERVLLPVDLPINAALIMGSVLLGVGALLNGACYLGSVLYVGGGNLNFLFTLAGLALGMRWTQQASPADASTMVHTMAHTVVMRPLWWLGLIAYLLIASLALWLTRARRTVLWPLCAGALAGLVFAARPGWSYGQVIDSIAYADWRGMTWQANGAALALFAGVIAGSIHAGRWHWQRPVAGRVLRCLCGGMLMGAGATLIPGGNDLLLLWSVPGLALYGGVAYAIMLATLAALFLGAEYWRRRARPATKLRP
jgi:uncharacterized protein